VYPTLEQYAIYSDVEHEDRNEMKLLDKVSERHKDKHFDTEVDDERIAQRT